MAWTTPKTDWNELDFFNYADNNRIVGNLDYLHELAITLFPPFEKEVMTYENSYAAIPYARKFMAIENNLETINNETYNLNIGQKATFTINGSTPLYVELNRIESACQRLYVQMKAHDDSRFHLAFKLGGDKIFNVTRES